MPNLLSVNFEGLDIYGLAFFNNKIPLIDEVIIKNDSDFDFKNIEVEISSSPSFFKNHTIKVAELSSGRYTIINNINLEIDTTKIMYFSAPVNSQVSVAVKNMGEVVEKSDKNVILLPHNFLPPISSYTEIISAYVTPSQEEIGAIHKSALDIILKEGKVQVNRDMWELNNPEYTIHLIKAVYKAIQDLRITLNTSINFNDSKPFQVMLPETTYQLHSGTSLEIALLTVSVAERLGINSFLVFLPEKVLAGFFTTLEHFHTCVSDDGRAFSSMKEGVGDNFCVVDVTSLINGTQVSFENSCIMAQKAIEAFDFPIVVDIASARKAGYHPLPNRINQSGNLIFESLNTEFACEGQKEHKKTFASASKLSEHIKLALSAQNGKASLLSLNNDNTILLLGEPQLVLKKIFLNGKISIKSFPISNDTSLSAELFEKIGVLNSNLDSNDISASTCAFYDKTVIDRKFADINDGNYKNSFTPCIAMGIVQYSENGHIKFAPLFLLPVNLEISSNREYFAKAIFSSPQINVTLIDFLSKKGIKIDASSWDLSVTESYAEIFRSIKTSLTEFTDFKFFDTTVISTFDFESQTLSTLASEEYLEKSPTLRRIFEKEKFNADSPEKSFSIESVDYPYGLDDSQRSAVNNAVNNSASVILASPASDKARVVASIVANSLKKGEKCLYITESTSDVHSFDYYLKKLQADKFAVYFGNDTKARDFEYCMLPYQDTFSKDELEKATTALVEKIDEQDLYFRQLHHVHEIGFSLYEAVSQYERYRSFPFSVSFTNEDVKSLSKNKVVDWFDTISTLAKAGADCKEPFSNPLSYVSQKEFSYDFKARSTIALNTHISIAKNFVDKQNSLANYLGFDNSVMREKQSDALVKILDLILSCADKLHFGIFSRLDVYEDFIKIDTLVNRCESFFELKKFVSDNFTHDITSLDIEELLSEWRSASSRIAFTRASAMNNVKSKLKAYSTSQKLITNDNFVSIIEKIQSYKDCLALIDSSSQIVLTTMGIDIKASVSNGVLDVFKEIAERAEIARQYLSLINEFYNFEPLPANVFPHHFNLFKSPEKLIYDIKSEYCNFGELYEEYKKSEEELVELLQIDIEKAKFDNEKIWYYFVGQFLTKMLDNIDMLKYWCKWNVERENAISEGLSSVVKLYESEQLTSGDIKNAFLKGFFKAVSEFLLSCLPFAASFSNEKQKNDADAIESLLSDYCKQLSSGINTAVRNNYLIHLKNAKIGEMEAYTQLRDKFTFVNGSTPTTKDFELLREAKPCFVCNTTNHVVEFSKMSEFDVLILDLSQGDLHSTAAMFLPLAKKVVIIDNSLPFESNMLTSAFMDISTPTTALKWTYNNSYTSLMVNELVYNNSLSATLPRKKEMSGCTVIRQMGAYDRKNTRVNVIEASAVVDEIIKLRSASPELSIGVYTLNNEQKRLIEMLLAKRLGTIDSQLNATDDEPFFVRSISDGEVMSRDVIIFSTVLSTEEKPKYKDTITKTIPELSGDRGIYTIVNVFSSAKKNFILVTSLTGAILDKFKSTEKGYCLFKKAICRLVDCDKNFLEIENPSTSADNSIVRDVANYIESLGYKVDLNVGYQNCLIDVCVRCKEKNKYVLGIVFDETASNLSENFLVRNMIFNNLMRQGGWNLHRIYTVEWFENQSKQLDLIRNLLNGDESDNDLKISAYLE